MFRTPRSWSSSNIAAFSGGAAAAAVTLDPAFLAPNVTLDATKLIATVGAGSFGMIRATKAIPTGGAFCAVHLDVLTTGGSAILGIIDSSNPASGAFVGQDNASGGVVTDLTNASKIYGGSTSSFGSPIIANTWLLLLYIKSSKTLHTYLPGVGWDVAGGGNVGSDTGGQALASIGSTVYFGATIDNALTKTTWNFGATSFDSSLTTAVQNCTDAGYHSLKDA